MIRLMVYLLSLFFLVPGIHAFHLTDPTLQPLLNPETNSLTIRSSLSKEGLTKVRVVHVSKRDSNNLPIEYHESIHIECATCKGRYGSCSCAMQASPSLRTSRVKEIVGSAPSSPMRKGEGSPLLHSSPHRKRTQSFDGPGSSVPSQTGGEILLEQSLEHTPESPNRCMQALVACLSFPQLLCGFCVGSTDLGVNICYDRYVLPYILPEEQGNDQCRSCMFPFSPCCMPQEEA